MYWVCWCGGIWTCAKKWYGMASLFLLTYVSNNCHFYPGLWLGLHWSSELLAPLIPIWGCFHHFSQLQRMEGVWEQLNHLNPHMGCRSDKNNPSCYGSQNTIAAERIGGVSLVCIRSSASNEGWIIPVGSWGWFLPSPNVEGGKLLQLHQLLKLSPVSWSYMKLGWLPVTLLPFDWPSAHFEATKQEDPRCHWY